MRFDNYTRELVFQKYLLSTDALKELDHLPEHAPRLSDGPPQMAAAVLRAAFAEMGD